MRLKTMIFILIIFTSFLYAVSAFADVDEDTRSELKLKEAPLDMKLSRNGEWLYVLTDSGNLLIYSSRGVFNAEMEVGKGVDQIEAGPSQQVLYLLNRKDKSIQAIDVEYQMAIDISGSPYKGPADAPVVIVEYTDFQCPYCARLGTTIDEVMRLYPGKLKIVYKSFPLNSHKYSWEAATAAMAAYERGKFWEFYKLLFDNYNLLNDAKIMEIRRVFGFDTPDFQTLMNSAGVRDKVTADREEGIRLGVNGTPTVFINGKRLKNKRLDGFKEAIENALKTSNK